MSPFAGTQGQHVPSGPRQPGASRRGGGGDRYHKRKAWLEILPDALSPPTRTHGNPFGFSNVPADRSIPLAFDHPLKEELAEVKRVRESRRVYWLQVAEALPDDMNNPGSYDHQRWKNEEASAEAKIEELAGLIALAERGITVERVGSPPVVVPVRDSAPRGIDEGAFHTRRNERASSPPPLRSARESNPRGRHTYTVSTREKERALPQRAAPGPRNNWPREPITQWKELRKGETGVQRKARRIRSKARLEKPQPPPAGPVIWTDNAKSNAVTKWMSAMGAAIGTDRTVRDIPLYIGGTGSGARSLGDDEINRSEGDVANYSQMNGRLSPIRCAIQGVWSPEDELHFEEAEAEREAERMKLARVLNAEFHRQVTTEKMASITSDQIKRRLSPSMIKVETSEPAEVETAEEECKDLLAGLLAELDSRTLSPSPKPQPLEQPPPAQEMVHSPLPDPPPVHDLDQAIAGAVWKALQARKAHKAAAAEAQDKETSEWMDIDKVAPMEVMDLQDAPDAGLDEEVIVKTEDSGQARWLDFTARSPLSGRVLYIGNLSFEADEEQLRDAFCNFQV